MGGGEALTLGHQYMRALQCVACLGFSWAVRFTISEPHLEALIGLEFAGELLHALVLHLSAYEQALDATILRGM